MDTRDLLRLTVSNLGRMKGRVVMTALGVVIGTAAVVVLISLASGLQQSAIRDLSSIGSLTDINVFPMGALAVFGAPASRQEEKLDDQTLAEFRKLPGVVAVTPKEPLNAPGVIRLNRLTGWAQIVGIDPREMDRLALPVTSGTARLGSGQAIVGAGVAKSFSDPQGRPLPQPPSLLGQVLNLSLSRATEDGELVERTVRIRVVGVLEKTGGSDDYTLFVSLQEVVDWNGWTAGRRVNPGRDGYSQVLIKVAQPDQVPAVEREVLRRGFYAYSAHTVLQQINSFFLVIQGVLGGIGAIALLVAAFGIANTMLMSIYERIREIGLMKAVGATNRDVMAVFLAESGSIGMLGGLGGTVLGILLGGVISLVARTYLLAQAAQSGGNVSEMPSFVHTPAWLPVFAILFATGVGVLSGLYPATRAAALEPITALRHE